MLTETTIEEIVRRKPYLRELLVGGQVGNTVSPHQWRLAPSRDGLLVPVLFAEGREQWLASRYELQREAERLLPPAKATLHRSQIQVCLGLGNPTAPLLLMERASEGQILIAVDESTELAALICRQVPGWGDYLRRPNAHLFAGLAGLALLDQYLESLPAASLSGIRFVRNPQSRRLSPDFYEQVETRIRSLLRARMSDLLTRFEFEQTWIANIVINSRYLPPADAHSHLANAGAYAGVLQGMPGVVISTGPSLRESMPLLRELRQRAFLLACDASLKPLLRAGIRPHAVITLDAQKHTLRHLAGEAELSQCLLFADVVASPFTLRAIQPRARIFSTTARVTISADGKLHRETTPGTEYLESLHGPMGGLQSGGSVATSAFDLLRNLGCSSIHLIGQDLAYTGRKIHCSGTHHTERWAAQLNRLRGFETINERIVRRRSTAPVPALDGGQTLGDFVLSLYRQWFEESAQNLALPLYNLTAAGACIAGFQRPKNLDEFVAGLPGIADPLQAFATAPPPAEYDHPENRRLYQLALRAIDDEEAREQMFSRYPMTRRLLRRADVYVQRNREKLGAARAEAVSRRFANEALRRFERSLRPYFRS